MEDLDRKAAARIEGLLAERGWTLPELARRSGVSLSTLRSAKKRGSRYCLETLSCICLAFGLSLADFVAGLEKN